MAYYRGAQSPRDEPQGPAYSNPLSPPRNPNRLSGGMVNSNNHNNDVRGSLTRRFTTNALPTLSPIGQQRMQAAGDYMVSDNTLPYDIVKSGGSGSGSGVRRSKENNLAVVACGGLDEEEKSSPRTVAESGGSPMAPSQVGLAHRRGKSCLGAIGREVALGSTKEAIIPTVEQFFSTRDSSLASIHDHSLTQDNQPSGYSRKTPSDIAVRHYEQLLIKQRELNAQFAQVDPDTRREVEEGLRHEVAITQMMASSEPASPPEYGNAFPSAFSKPNRYSTASLTSQHSISHRPNRSSTHLTSPSAGVVRPYTSGNANLPSQSVPGSRRQSDDEEEDDFIYGFESAIHRAAANPNRNSMPITGYKRNTTDLSFGPVNTTSFLFDDDEDSKPLQTKSNTTSPPSSKTYLQVQQTADGFPKLIRREDTADLSSSALDLALAQGVEPQQQLTDRATASRHRISLPPSALSSNVNIAPLNSILANADSKSTANRRSVEFKLTAGAKRPALMASPPRDMSNGVHMAQPSYSTNDIPTLKTINGDTTSAPITSPPSQINLANNPTSPEQVLSRVTSAAAPTNQNRQSQDFTSVTKEEQVNGFTSSQSGFQANATPFNPFPASQDSAMPNFGQTPMSPYAQPPYFGGYNMQMLSNGFGNMNVGGNYGAQPQWPGQMSGYGQQSGFNGYQQYGQGGQAVAGAGRFPEGQRANTQQRRQANEDALARFNSIDIADLTGEIYSLCKDQHGCRFLQRKLDERNDQTTSMIFEEVKEHIIELMTDPFGNYLCQKLLESTNDDQRTVLIKNAMPAMTKIALNQHGTRALQKMIEFISTKAQTELIIEALRFDVVQLIQDLNGNHVIQKCLNHLSPEDAQFIFAAVGANCVTVGTHRHGCCVLQRCIDHAAGFQKGALVDQVIDNAFALVQDPFGNYVVQYILDLEEPCFTEPLCRSFLGNIAVLSKQKFSSNVIEKCIRCAADATKRQLVYEIAAPLDLEKLLRDSFANYVVQTAMDHADDESKSVLMENIRPILPTIRHTPYGRRIQQRVSDYDGSTSGLPSGVATPADPTSPPNGMSMPNMPYAAQSAPAPTGRGNRQGWVGPPPQWGVNGGFGAGPMTNGFNPNGFASNGMNGDIISPTPQRRGHSNSIFSDSAVGNQGFGGQGFSPMGRQAQPYGHF